MKKKNKVITVLAVVLFVFLFTNPTLKDFKDSGHEVSRREWNFLFFSIYKETIAKESPGHIVYSVDVTYFAILKNFFEINRNAN